MPNLPKEFINYLRCPKCGLASVDAVYRVNVDVFSYRENFLYLQCPECGAKYEDLSYKVEEGHISYTKLKEYREVK